MKKTLYLVFLAPLALTACGGNGVLGGKSLPDETTVVDGPPLTLPPRFELRPPADGSMAEVPPAPTNVPENEQWILQQTGTTADADIRQKLDVPVEEKPAEEPTVVEEGVMEENSGSSWFGGWRRLDETTTE